MEINAQTTASNIYLECGASAQCSNIKCSTENCDNLNKKIINFEQNHNMTSTMFWNTDILYTENASNNSTIIIIVWSVAIFCTACTAVIILIFYTKRKSQQIIVAEQEIKVVDIISPQMRNKYPSKFSIGSEGNIYRTIEPQNVNQSDLDFIGSDELNIKMDVIDESEEEDHCWSDYADDDGIYSVLFATKPFGITFKTNFEDKNNLFVKQIDEDSVADKKNVILGSHIVKLQDEWVEDLGNKEIYKLFKRKLREPLPLKITFRKPRNDHLYDDAMNINNYVKAVDNIQNIVDKIIER